MSYTKQIPISGAKETILDPHYRYQMPVMQVTYAKRNTTVISNLDKVGLALARNPSEILKYLCKELGVSSGSAAKDGEGRLKGKHEPQALMKILSKYIDLCVLCSRCGNPETVYDCKHGNIVLTCRACGSSIQLPDDDQYIIGFIKKSFGKLPRKRQVKEKDSRSINNDPHDNEQHEIAWNEGTDDAEALDQTVKVYRRFLRKRWKSGDIKEAVAELSNRQVAAILPASFRFPILIRAVLRKSSTTALWRKDVQLMIPILEILIESFPSTSDCEREILAALEFVCLDRPKMFPVLVLDLYLADVLEEDTVLSWAHDVSMGRRSYPRDIVDETGRQNLLLESKPLIDWLLSSEEEEENK